MIEFFNYLNLIFGSFYFLLAVVSGSLLIKSYILIILVKNGYRADFIARKPWFFLSCALVGAMLSDFSWVVKLTHNLFFSDWDSKYISFVVDIAWAFVIVQYHGFGLFLESLISRNFYFRVHQKILLLCSFAFFSLCVGIAFMYFGHPVTTFVLLVRNIQFFYMCFCTIIPSLLFTLYIMRKRDVPLILQKQLNIFIKGFIIPYLLVDFMQLYPFNTALNLLLTNYSVVSVSSLIITYGMFFCAKKVMGFRFLNFKSHVISGGHIGFIDSFKQALDRLSQVATMQELQHITQTFFKDAFHIPAIKTTLIIRQPVGHEFSQGASVIEATIENFMSVHSSKLAGPNAAAEGKVLIYDEIVFNNFYEQHQITESMGLFLDTINADIFIPICERQTIIAGIIVGRDARPGIFYSETERDQMHMFVGYLGAIIKLIQHKNLDNVLMREKEMRDVIYTHQHELMHYKEAVQTFLRASRKGEEGIIFYKNRQFSFGNQAAKDFVGIDLNAQGGHPLTQSLKKLVSHVQEYKKFQSTFIQGVDETILVTYGIPSLNGTMVIITIGYPDIGDIIKKNIDLLKNPSDWDYLLYLETTNSGQRIHKYLPGSSDGLLNSKISLLKDCLSKRTIFLEVATDDMAHIMQIFGHVDEQEPFYVLNDKHSEAETHRAMPFEEYQHAMLKKLERGTIWINNIHTLSSEEQTFWATVIKFGSWVKDPREESTPPCLGRIVCASTDSWQKVVGSGTLIKPLMHELECCVRTNMIQSLSDKDLLVLVESIIEQFLSEQAFKNLLELTEREKMKIIQPGPESVDELRNKVLQALVQKSKRNLIYSETEFGQALNVDDPELVQAARMGKNALKEPDVMALLWKKFDKNQYKIARFLGVNRSSIFRRCKEYDLQ